MGILNLTPDSFAEARPLDVAGAVAHALAMEEAGADIIDIGGESTRPGAAPVSDADERQRILPVIERLAARLRVPMSVDTYKAAIAVEAIGAGVAMVNDVSGFQYDPAMPAVVAAAGAGVVLMHTRGRSDTMYAGATYRDLVGEVCAELAQAMDRGTAAGVAPNCMILDPGIGFAKRPEHSYGVLASVPELALRMKRPLLIGPSRKSFMAAALGQRPAPERDWGTAAAVTAAVLAGAHILRVHAVAEMTQVVRVAEQIRRSGLENVEHAQ